MLGYLTQGEMINARYSPLAAKLLSVMILVFMTLNAASQMVGIGNFFGTYLGMNYEIAVVVGTGIVLIYSMFGGFRGVVLTDIIQFVLLAISAFIVFIVAMINSGGFENIALTAEQAGLEGYMSFSAGAGKYMVYVITFGGAWVIQANVWQRISAARDDKDARKMTVMSFFAYIPLYLMVVLTGMAGITLFDEIPQGGVVTAIVTQYMNPVLGALVFVGISAAIMSTMDSLINTGAMTLSIDLVGKGESEEKKLKFSRFATLLVTGVALIISLRIRSILEIAWMASDIITTGVLVPLVMGFFWKRGNSKGAVASMAAGLIYCLYNLIIGFGVQLPSFWEQQSALQVILGVLLSFIVYVSVSLLTAPETEKAEEFIKKSRGK